jgi:hypothetical protein
MATMKKVIVIASLLISLFGLTLQNHAAQQEGSAAIKQKITKTGRTAAAHARVFYRDAPRFGQIAGTSITYATNTSQAVLKIDDAFYFLFSYYDPIALCTREIWLVSASAQGPWVPAQSVPEIATEIVCSQINSNPDEPYQLCALPWPS